MSYKPLYGRRTTELLLANALHHKELAKALDHLHTADELLRAIAEAKPEIVAIHPLLRQWLEAK